MACWWPFRTRLLITLFSVYQVSSWDVKGPASAVTAGDVATAIYSRRPGDETAFAVLLVQSQPTQTFSVIATTTATDEDPHTVIFQVPTQAAQGVYKIMVASQDTKPSRNLPSSFGRSDSFSVDDAGGQPVAESPVLSSELSQSSGTSVTSSRPDPLSPSNTADISTELPSSTQSPSLTVTVTMSPNSSQSSTTAVPVGAIVGGLIGSLVLIIGLIFIIMHLRRRNRKASAKQTAPSLFLELNEDINGLPTLTKITSDSLVSQSGSDVDRSWTGTGMSQSNDTSLNDDSPPSYSSHYSSG